MGCWWADQQHPGYLSFMTATVPGPSHIGSMLETLLDDARRDLLQKRGEAMVNS